MNDTTIQPENRFVILFHRVSDKNTLSSVAQSPSRRSDHWDLMFESEGQLLTWAVETEPFQNRTSAAIQLPNHRLDYLTYEGPITENRGEVRRTLAGSFRIVDPQNHRPPKKLSQWVAEGSFQLSLIAEDLQQNVGFQRETGDRWTLNSAAENC